MAYLFRGRLSGLICDECLEPLSNVKVRLYRIREGQDVTALAVANPKETFAVLSDAQVKEKAQSLFAEAETDAQGNFTFELGEKQGYRGGAFELDVSCGTVPHRKALPRREPVQFSLTTLQPQWRQSETGNLWAWNYSLPYRFWCWIRGLFGAWTVCGKVVTCDTQKPVSGVKVSAFDADWLQDDALGSANTDGAGRFRLDYAASDFKKTLFSPLLNLEWVGGPDLYFKIETGGGTVLLSEPRSRGRASDRENAGPCFCVELCVDVAEQPPFNNPLFTHVGDFHILTDISAVSGRTNAAVLGHGGPDYGFEGALKLRGFCPKTSPVGAPDPMRYRFLYSIGGGAPQPITGSLLYPVLVGARLIQWDIFGTGLSWTFQSIYVAGSGATPDPTPTPVVPPGTPWGPVPAHVVVPDSDGWIQVDPNALDSGFYGPLLRFNTPVAVPGGAAPGNGAGNALTDPKNGTDLAITFEAGPVGGAATFSNTLSKLHVNNWSEVELLDLTQFHGPGSDACSELTNALDIRYTADHALMASWSIAISSASGSAPGTIVPPFPAGSTARGGIGTYPTINISSWAHCSYRVSLTTRRRLTDGETDDSDKTTELTFCK
jgi:hypothetical protein